MMPSVMTDVVRRARRPKQIKLNTCPVCRAAVTEREERLRLRGGTYVHRWCGTYQVRLLDSVGARYH
jgi:RNase P subunit RPR2